MSNKLYDFTTYTKMNGYTGEHKINNQRKRADKWAKKYSEDLKNYKKLIIENEQLRQTNHELNLMHHQAIMKVLHLGQQLKKEKEND